MSKPKKGIGAWLSDIFGDSHKAISENLSTEQYNQFVKSAEKLQPADSDETDDDDADEDDDDDDKQDADPKNKDPKNTDFESRLKSLEDGLKLSQAALKSEKKTVKALTTKLTEAESKVTASEDKNKKLRQAINPLGDEDLANSESQNGLTKVDIEARESYKKNRSED